MTLDMSRGRNQATIPGLSPEHESGPEETTSSAELGEHEFPEENEMSC